MVDTSTTATKAALLTIGTALLVAVPAVDASAAKTHWTHPTRLKRACAIHENLPKPGVPTRSRSLKAKHRVGVRYTYKGYALVLDYAKSKGAKWGFIAQSCLNDPHAHSEGDHGSPLPDQRAIGGKTVNHKHVIKTVKMSAPHAGKTRHTPLHTNSGGSLRDGKHSFVVGNARKGDIFYIATTHCGHHPRNAWILGYLSASGRWGYLEAQHLPACL
jgi:hypothetical protein